MQLCIVCGSQVTIMVKNHGNKPRKEPRVCSRKCWLANPDRYPVESRFWKMVNKDGPIYQPLGHCWLWTGSKNGCGYGVILVRAKGCVAHRNIPLDRCLFDHIPFRKRLTQIT